MKKLILFVSSVFIFLGLFTVLKTFSFADVNYNLPTVVNYTYTPPLETGSHWANETNQRLQVRNPSSAAGIAVVQSGNKYVCYSADYIMYGSSSTDVLRTYLYCGTSTQTNQLNPTWGPSNTPAGWLMNAESQVININTYTGKSLSIEAPVFDSIQSARNYIETGDTDGVVSDEGNFLDPNIDWGSNGSPLSSNGKPDTYNIPAPQFNISYDSNGNVIHSITFTNFEYDSRSQDGKYGIVMNASWGTFDDFSLTHTGSLFDTTYSVTYGVNISDRPVFDIFDLPVKASDINYCPQSLNFNQNTISLNEFNNMINMNPVNSRTVNVPASEPNDILENQFKDYLSKPQCPYNYLVFSCYYYKPNGDGTFSFGPTTTGSFYPPNQGAIYNAGRFNGQDGNMQPGSGGGAGGNGGNWNNNWGNGNTNINLDYGSNVDPSQLVNNMNSLLGFIGNVPNFVAQLFSFLPEWLIIFIAVSIGLMVAIGVVKLFLG